MREKMSCKGREEHTTFDNKSKLDMPENEYAGSQNNLVSSTNLSEEHNIIIVEESSDPHSITGILNVCKKKILRPYMRFLSLMGLRPIFGESTEAQCLWKCLNSCYNVQVLLFLITGYFLQYISCFRRDRGFGSMSSTHVSTKLQMKILYDETCSSSIASSFIIPSLLHFAGYIYALVVFRRSDDDHLPVLIERVFLTSSHVTNMQLNQRHIVITLWIFVIGSFLWMLSSITLVTYMMAEGDITFKWLDQSAYSVKMILKVLLVVCIIWHDMVQAIVISNYCLQVQLLKMYVQYIREILLQQSVRPLNWIRDIEEFRKLLNYLNDEMAPAVCFFTLVNWTYAISGTLWLLAAQYDIMADSVPLYAVVNILNVVLWWFIAAVPFVQAARLTMACDNVKTVGQEVRTRPSPHQDTPLHELNSILIYTTSLKINAKLFNLPINGKYTGLAFAVIVVYFLVLGNSNYISH